MQQLLERESNREIMIITKINQITHLNQYQEQIEQRQITNHPQNLKVTTRERILVTK
jgi:hypothetical protein